MKLTIVIKTKMPDNRYDHQVQEHKSEHLIIGRIEGDIIISDAKCSRQHALLYEAADGKLHLRDLNSTNGTFVDEVKVPEDCALSEGDEIRIGGTLIELLKVQLNAKASRRSAKRRKKPQRPEEVTETNHGGVIHRWPDNIYCLPKEKQREYVQFLNRDAGGGILSPTDGANGGTQTRFRIRKPIPKS